MPDTAPNLGFLKGKQVVFTGRLASMTRPEAAALVREHGGVFVSAVSRRTSLLVVGQDGWPLEKDGRLTHKLRKADSLQRAGFRITVISEEELFARIGLNEPVEGIRKLYSTAQLSGLLKIPGDQLRKWVRDGLIQPVDTDHGVSQFDYSQVVSARTLYNLTQAGVKPDHLRRSFRQLQTLLKNVKVPGVQLAFLERDGELLVRLDDGLAEPSGQRCFDFGATEDEPKVSLSRPSATAEELFALGCEHEEANRLGEAVEAYRQSLLLSGPNTAACFNLANSLYAMGMKEQAVERYYQVVELDRTFAESWNNLGIVLAELQRPTEAANAFEQALAANPRYIDAHYNLADLLDETGNQEGAQEHWRVFVSQEQRSDRAIYARERLIETGG